MTSDPLIQRLHGQWFDQISESLQSNSTLSSELSADITKFGELVVKALESGDPGWLKPLLIEWAQRRTLISLDNKAELPPIMSTIILEVRREAKERLSEEESLQLMDALIPIFSYCFEEIAYHEMLIRVGDISLELEQVTERLTSIDRSKSDFISVAAHELKTPLTLIEGYAAMLRDKIPRDVGGVETGLLNGIAKGTKRLGEIINDMIDVSLIDNDLLSLKFQPTWINQLLKGIKGDVKKSLSERNQILDITDFQGAREMTFADTERIQQALHNVITNAMKYTPDGGVIVVDGRVLGGFIEVQIIDQGIGVDEDDKDKIFEKFISLSDTALHSSGKLKYRGDGPGLGLPIAKGIIEAHGGTIWVESEGYDDVKFPGSTFHLLIPLRTEPPDDKLMRIFKPNEVDDAGD